MKFGERLTSLLTPEWRNQYVDYNRLKKILYEYVNAAPKSGQEEYFANFDKIFFSECQVELNKINYFFKQKLAENQRKLYEITLDLDRWKTLGRNKIAFAKEKPNGKGKLRKMMRPPFLPSKGNPTDDIETTHAKTKDQLKLAFSEFYLSLVLLQKYQINNSTGLQKILKKRDKLVGNSKGLEWRKENVEKSPYHLSKDIDTMIKDVEDTYIHDLEAGDRSLGMKRLRVPPLEEKQSAWTTFRLGLFTGSFLVLVLMIIFSVSQATYAHKEPPFLGVRLFRGHLILFSNMWLIGANMYGWRKAGVNHVLIFEIDPRQHITYQTVMEVGSFLLMLWALAVIGFLYGPLCGIPSLLFPILLFLVSLLWLVYPLNYPSFMIRSSRMWFMKHVFLCFTAPFHFVHFADFWLADQMNSMVAVFLDFQYFVCFYTTEVSYGNGTVAAIPSNGTGGAGISYEDGADSCSSNLYGIRPMISVLPALIRFLQCVRRFRDTKNTHPHLSNAVKYATSFFVVLFGALSTWYKDSHGSRRVRSPFFFFWLLAYVLSFSLTYTWDVIMDWGLFEPKTQKKNKFLRDELVYNRRWYYYGAICGDLILRLCWVLNVSLADAGTGIAEILLCVTSPLECIRRFIWNYFRLENEHLNNCGQFRAVRDISIKPHKIGEIEDPVKISDEKEEVPHRAQLSNALKSAKRKSMSVKKKISRKYRSAISPNVSGVGSRSSVGDMSLPSTASASGSIET